MDEKQISELLECSVCLERFDQSCKVLPCQHTFCRRCLDEILLTKHELRCPECRALVTIRVADLPTNILVVRILEGLKTKGYRPTGGGGRLHHGPINLISSPSKSGGSNPLHCHDPVSAHHFRQATQPCAKAMYNYEPSEKEDLPFKKGDIILLRRQIDENWFQGELAGRLGFFPANFVQVLVPLPQIPQCRALYDFDLKDESEKDCLSFKKDEVLTVIRRVDENWLEGRKGDKIGIFPITFVELNDSARSLINTKSNLTILPSSSSSSSSSSSVPGTSSSCSTTAGTTSLTNSNRNAASQSSTTTNCAVTTSTSSAASSVEERLVASTSPSLDATSSDTTVVSTSDSQAEAAVSAATTTTITSSSPPVNATDMATPSSSSSEVQPQNKRHSYTSPSLSVAQSTSVTSDVQQQRHSAEVTLTSGGNLTIASSDVTTVTASSSSSSLPSSAEAQVTTSSSPKNTPSAADTETDAASSSATSSSGNVQSGSLTVPLYEALYNYKPQKDDELELFKGDFYTVTEKCQDGWYKGACINGHSGVFPGNYVRMVRHPSAFKPVNPNVLNIRAKGPAMSTPTVPAHSTSTGDQRPAQVSTETSSQAPPLMPRVARMAVPGPKARSPSSQLANTPLRSLSTPGTSSISSTSPKHVFSSPSSTVSSSPPSSHISFHSGLSRPMIPAPPPSTTSSPHRSLWVPPNLAAMQQTMSASANITPPNVVMAQSLDSPAAALATSGKDKKEKKEKERKSLVKLLSGKSKKSKQAPPDPEPTPTLSVLCFDNVAHVRSGSYPANGTATSSVSAGGDAIAHRKAASFDATTTPPVPAKPRPKPVLRERYCCIVPYPPQTEQELALELGDIIHVHRKREDGWYKGTQERTGKTGMFPAIFVEKCD